MTQDDNRELKGWARSIDSLFDDSEARSDDLAEADLEQAPTPGGDQPEVDEVETPDHTLEFGEFPELVAEPEVAEPEVAEPEVAEPEVSEPEVSEPEVSEPEVSEPEVPEPELPEPPSDEVPAAAEPDSDEPEEEPRSPVELQLEAAVSGYLTGTSEQRPSLEGPLREAVEAARAANALDGLARAMNSLLAQPVPDPNAETLAVDLMNAATQMRMAILLGGVRDEHERSNLVQAYAKLGDPMATAIADALTETDDRLARKTYVTALVALGQSGMRVVEAMLEDSRWFVARNGVAVLGEVGGDTAIAHLTGTLAHEDARVRRETVQSLAKFGGEDAALLVLGMLNDSDPDVRATAARGVSVLKVERAHRPLMDILEKGDEDTVVEQVVRALGQLGDPFAVPLIEKRAVGSFYYKPSVEVRVAALSALAAIGTPHAMSVVEGATDDKDAKIRAVVQQILSGK